MLQYNKLLPDHPDCSEKYRKSSSRCRGAYSKTLIFGVLIQGRLLFQNIMKNTSLKQNILYNVATKNNPFIKRTLFLKKKQTHLI